MGVKDFVLGAVDNLWSLIFEMRRLRKRETGNRAKVKVLLNNGDVELHKGILTNDHKFMYVPDMDRTYIKPLIHREEGRMTVFVPEDSHGKLDISFIKNVAMAQRYRLLIKWPWLRNWENTKTSIVSNNSFDRQLAQARKDNVAFCEVLACGTIDWSVFSNDISPDFAGDSWLVNQAAVLNFLKDITNWKLILTIISCVLFGFVLGLIFGSVVL
jgi:hypothetical protein